MPVCCIVSHALEMHSQPGFFRAVTDLTRGTPATNYQPPTTSRQENPPSLPSGKPLNRPCCRPGWWPLLVPALAAVSHAVTMRPCAPRWQVVDDAPRVTVVGRYHAAVGPAAQQQPRLHCVRVQVLLSLCQSPLRCHQPALTTALTLTVQLVCTRPLPPARQLTAGGRPRLTLSQLLAAGTGAAAAAAVGAMTPACDAHRRARPPASRLGAPDGGGTGSRLRDAPGGAGGHCRGGHNQPSGV